MGRFSKLLDTFEASETTDVAVTKAAESGIPQDLIKLAAEASAVAPVTPVQKPKSSKEDDWLNTKIKMHSRLIDEIDLTALDGMDTSAHTCTAS